MGNRIEVRVDSELRELIPGFMENRRRELEMLRADLADRRFDAVRKVGHTLAGVGASYGFDDISRIGRELERVAGVPPGIASSASVPDPDCNVAPNLNRLVQLADELEWYLRHVEPVYT